MGRARAFTLSSRADRHQLGAVAGFQADTDASAAVPPPAAGVPSFLRRIDGMRDDARQISAHSRAVTDSAVIELHHCTTPEAARSLARADYLMRLHEARLAVRGRVLAHLLALGAANGPCPSNKQVAAALGIGEDAAADHIRDLVAMGRLRRGKGRLMSRSLILVGAAADGGDVTLAQPAAILAAQQADLDRALLALLERLAAPGRLTPRPTDLAAILSKPDAPVLTDRVRGSLARLRAGGAISHVETGDGRAYRLTALGFEFAPRAASDRQTWAADKIDRMLCPILPPGALRPVAGPFGPVVAELRAAGDVIVPHADGRFSLNDLGRRTARELWTRANLSRGVAKQALFPETLLAPELRRLADSMAA